MSNLKDFTVSKPRPLPVILLADASGSMSYEGKIDALNQSVRQMMDTFSDEDDLRAQIQVCVIAFGGDARLHVPLLPAAEIIKDQSWVDLEASGHTPLGAAMRITADLIEDREKVPARAYRPTVVLVSDGLPNDDWEPALIRLTQEGRAQKADRMALAIGGDADEGMLKQFLNDPEKQVYHAEDARRIKDFFRFVTMTVTKRSVSVRSGGDSAPIHLICPFKKSLVTRVSTRYGPAHDALRRGFPGRGPAERRHRRTCVGGCAGVGIGRFGFD